MAIAASDIKLYLSGGAGNTAPNSALGGVMSTTTEVVDDTLQNLFDNVTGAEHTAGDTNYRCFYVKNAHATDTAYSVKIYISANTTAVDDTINIGKDLAGVSGTADTVADEDTAPDPAVTFSTATTLAVAVDLGNLSAGQYYAVWVKRIVSAGSTAQANNTTALTVSLDTA